MEIPSEIYNLISHYLCPVDHNSLRFVCKSSHIIPQPDIKKIILSQLSKYTDDPEEFLEQLNQYGAIIAGSFILACLYNTDEYHDIDIFEYMPSSKNRLKYGETHITPSSEKLNLFYISSLYDDTPTDTFRMYLQQKYRTCHMLCSRHAKECRLLGCHNESQYKQLKRRHPDLDNYVSEMTCTIREYNDIFQHICVPLEPMQYIKRSFDLDICKVAFDGKELYVRDWDKLFSRRDTIRPNAYIMLYYENSTSFEEIYEKRYNKYEQKGFKIIRHPKHDEMIEYMKELSLELYEEDKDRDPDIPRNLLYFVKNGQLNLENFD